MAPAIRMLMTLGAAEQLASMPNDQGVVDQLWLRSILIEQRRRTRINERQAFDERADRVLGRLDAREP